MLSLKQLIKAGFTTRQAQALRSGPTGVRGIAVLADNKHYDFHYDASVACDVGYTPVRLELTLRANAAVYVQPLIGSSDDASKCTFGYIGLGATLVRNAAGVAQDQSVTWMRDSPQNPPITRNEYVLPASEGVAPAGFTSIDGGFLVAAAGTYRIYAEIDWLT